MFYPEESLRRGGRFYLCWVADSWPLRFSAITHRQLWSTDIRKLCQELMEVVSNESGRPTNRFSLRLSSQLMRGLVRLYERKVFVLLSDLCMIHANVFKSTNKKLEWRDNARPVHAAPLEPVAAIRPEEPENDQRVEELIQNSANVVANIEDITLKEAVIPDFQLPPNDNFGEENPEQAAQVLLADRTVEQMLLDVEPAGVHTSGLEMGDRAADTTPRPPAAAATMEEAADVTMFRKSVPEELLPTFEREVPEIPDPALQAPIDPIPPQEQVVEETIREANPVPVESPPPPPRQRPSRASTSRQRPQSDEDDELEELEEQPARKRRRARTSLIVDKRTIISSEVMHARTANPHVDTRLQDSDSVIITVRTPAGVLLGRPAHAGGRARDHVSPALGDMFRHNLVPVGVPPLADRQDLEKETEQPLVRRTRASRSTLERIVETEEPPAPAPAPADQPAAPELTMNLTAPEDVLPPAVAEQTVGDFLNVFRDVPNVEIENVPMQIDISDLPTQKIAAAPQGKRSADTPPYIAKRLRSAGYVSFRESQQQQLLAQDTLVSDKENIPPNIPAPAPAPAPAPSPAHATRLLLEAGLADISQKIDDQRPQAGSVLTERRARGSESSETPLGSLDRTRVSLGDAPPLTESQATLRRWWGVEGTMTKVMLAVKDGSSVTVDALLARTPPPPPPSPAPAAAAAAPPALPPRRLAAAMIFSSLLKLKQHGFIRIIKDPDSLEILDILLGPKFDNL